MKKERSELRDWWILAIQQKRRQGGGNFKNPLIQKNNVDTEITIPLENHGRL